MTNEKRVLGFDISTSCIGWGLLQINEDQSITYLNSGYFNPIKEGNIIKILADTRNKVLEIIKVNEPDYIGIEKLIEFMKGKSSAKTIIALTGVNRMVSLLAYDYLAKPPELLNVLSIRHGIKLTKILPKKEEIPELVAKHLNIVYPYEYTTRSKKLCVENFDRADGIAVALYYAFLLSGKIKPKKEKVI
jgi:hypothetical protein